MRRTALVLIKLDPANSAGRPVTQSPLPSHADSKGHPPMTTATLSRSQNGMRLVMRTGRTWSVGLSGFQVPSQTTAGVRYTVTHDTCSCRDFFYRGPIVCKHI